MKYLLIFEKFESTILYHGSDRDFDEFDEEKISSGDSSELFGKGYYLTNNLDIAKHYAILKAKQAKIVGHQKGIFDTKVPIYSKDADEYAELTHKINKFQISGNILNIDTFILDNNFISKLEEIYLQYNNEINWFNNILDWCKNKKEKIKDWRGEILYMIDRLPFDNQMIEKLVKYIKDMGYDGVKYRSDKSFEKIDDWNYCIYNKNIIKKLTN